MLNKLIHKIKSITKKNQVVFNLGYGDDKNKKVLISYLVDHYFNETGKFQFSTNRTECSIIVNEFIAQGYTVDVIYCNSRLNIKKEYDLVIGFGHAFRNATCSISGRKILYLTEAHPSLSYENELKMFQLMNKENSNLERSGTYYLTSDFDLTDEIVCLGEKHQKYINELYENKKVISIYPTGIPYTSKVVGISNDIPKTFSSKEFLWFGSRGITHKGLDLLLDIFANNPNLILHIAGITEKELIKSGRKFKSNIICYGKIDVNSEVFEKISNQVNYTILPSASEGIPTGIITCMQRGMIPIVSEYCGTDFDNNAILIKYLYNRDALESLLIYLSHKDVDHKEKERVKKYSIAKFSKENYKKQWCKIISDL